MLAYTLVSGIDVGQGINVGPGKFGWNNKRRALNKRRAITTIKFENTHRARKKWMQRSAIRKRPRLFKTSSDTSDTAASDISLFYLNLTPYLSALNFSNSPVWNIGFEKLDFFPCLNSNFLPAVAWEIQVWNRLYFHSFKLDISNSGMSKIKLDIDRGWVKRAGQNDRKI